MDFVSVGLFLALFVVALLYYYGYRRYRYWTDRNIPQVNSTFPMGSMKGLGTQIHLADLLDDVYKRYKTSTPYVGMYFTVLPMLMLTDLDLVKDVLTKDFNYFYGRGMYVNERDDPLSGHLFAIEGERWRYLRNKLSPTFSSGKIRMMFESIRQVGDEFLHAFDKYIDRDEPIDVKNLSQCFTCDVIGSCAFGLQCNALRDESCRMIEVGDMVFKPSPLRSIFTFTLLGFKNFSRSLHLKLLPAEVTDYFMGLVRTTVQYREENSIERPDFLSLLIQLKNKGTIEDGGNDATDKLTLNEVAAQAFVFFLAGFETSSTTLSFALYLLASHPEIQEKARAEILDKLRAHGNEISYDAMKDMTYLDQIINETLRMYPPLSQLIRVSNAPYRVASSNITLEKGTQLLIPIYSFHYDPDQYPNPHQFDPDRFAPEMVQKRHACAFLPFGDGPRNCIGMRFGLLETKFGIVQLLTRLRFTVNARTKTPIALCKKSQFLTAEGGLWLDAKRL